MKASRKQTTAAPGGTQFNEWRLDLPDGSPDARCKPREDDAAIEFVDFEYRLWRKFDRLSPPVPDLKQPFGNRDLRDMRHESADTWLLNLTGPFWARFDSEQEAKRAKRISFLVCALTSLSFGLFLSAAAREFGWSSASKASDVGPQAIAIDGLGLFTGLFGVWATLAVVEFGVEAIAKNGGDSESESGRMPQSTLNRPEAQSSFLLAHIGITFTAWVGAVLIMSESAKGPQELFSLVLLVVLGLGVFFYQQNVEIFPAFMEKQKVEGKRRAVSAAIFLQRHHAKRTTFKSLVGYKFLASMPCRIGGLALITTVALKASLRCESGEIDENHPAVIVFATVVLVCILRVAAWFYMRYRWAVAWPPSVRKEYGFEGYVSRVDIFIWAVLFAAFWLIFPSILLYALFNLGYFTVVPQASAVWFAVGVPVVIVALFLGFTELFVKRSSADGVVTWKAKIDEARRILGIKRQDFKKMYPCDVRAMQVAE